MHPDRPRLGRSLVLSVVVVTLAGSAVACDDDENSPSPTTVSLEIPNTSQPSGTLEPGTNQSTPQNQIPGATTGGTTGG